MQWNDDKDVLLMREVLGKSVLILKPGSQERGQAWQRVADKLNALGGFHLTGRAVRDRIRTLIKKFKVKINKEKNQTGEGGGEPGEFEVLVEEVIDISEDTLKKRKQRKRKLKRRRLMDKTKLWKYGKQQWRLWDKLESEILVKRMLTTGKNALEDRILK